MKAFKLFIPGLTDEEGPAIAVAPNAAKARYLLLMHCQDFGFKNAATGKRWPTMPDIQVRRAPTFDALAAEHTRPIHWAQRYAVLELEALALKAPLS